MAILTIAFMIFFYVIFFADTRFGYVGTGGAVGWSLTCCTRYAVFVLIAFEMKAWKNDIN
jgi:hypothetical protein